MGHPVVRLPIGDIAETNQINERQVALWRTNPKEKVHFNIGITYKVGKFVENVAPEFSLSIIVWEEDEEIKDNGAVESYDEIPITFTDSDRQTIIDLICDSFRETVQVGKD